jgi:hypothetical protein
VPGGQCYGPQEVIASHKPRRFDREAYVRERERWGTVRAVSAFWREIPSVKLYLFAAEIVNLNLTYESPKAAADNLRRALAKQLPARTEFTVTFQCNPPLNSPQAGN